MNKWNEPTAVPFNDMLDAILHRHGDVESMQENIPLIVTKHFTVSRDMLGTPKPHPEFIQYDGLRVHDNQFHAWIDRMLYGNSYERIKRS